MSTHTTNQNPFVRPSHPLPFGDMSADFIEPAIDFLLDEARARIDEMVAIGEPRTYANTMETIDVLTEDLNVTMGLVEHLEELTGAEDIRAAYKVIQPKVAAFVSSIATNAGIWSAMKQFAETEEAQVLDPVKNRFLRLTMDDFRRQGAELSDPDKATLQDIDVELAQVTHQFGQNATDATDAFEFYIENEADLAGLPTSAVNAARASAAAKDRSGWRFTLQAPSLRAVLSHLDNGDIRKRIYLAANTRCTAEPFDNRGALQRILNLRAQRAKLLGYDDISALLLEDRMVRSGIAAKAFVEDLKAKSEAFARTEHEALELFWGNQTAQSRHGNSHTEAWSTAYIAEKQRRSEYDFDDEALRPYFSIEVVLGGLFNLLNQLYGVTIQPVDDWPTWHKNVEPYALYEADGTLSGVFYLDLFPREGKRSGAWMRPMLTAPTGVHGSPHVGVVCGNMSAPTGDGPALLTHREVETVFHEFGHLMHHLFSRGDVRSLMGTNVAWDFVELPSQIMENWCWEREALNIFARHHETDEPIPDELYQKMKAARTFRSGSAMMRQLCFASLDLALHREYRGDDDGDAVSYARDIAQRFSMTPLPSQYSMVTTFLHLFAHPVGYATGYYSYKWAEVLEADAFSRFAGEGLFSREVGADFRSKILEVGNGCDPHDAFVSFMGREPNPEALFIREGLTTEEASSC